jgi:hypothetical protein
VTTSSNLPALIDAEMTLAKALAHSELLPKAYRQKPANVLWAISLGRALGLEPAIALTAVQVIDGQPSLSAQAQAALVRRAGHKLRVTGDDTEAVAVLIRTDDPGYEHTARWTIERARAAGLAGRGAWRTYPAAMLQARAITEVVRAAASDVLLGISYTTVEELGHDDPHEVFDVDPDTGEILPT